MASSAEKRKRHPPTKMSVYMRRWRAARKAGGHPLQSAASKVRAALRAEKRTTTAVKPSKLARKWLTENVRLENLPTLVLASDIGQNLPVDVAAITKTHWAGRYLRALGAAPLAISVPDGSNWTGWI